MLSCTAVNPAYGVSASGSMSATDPSGEGKSTSGSSSNPDSDSSQTTQAETVATEPASGTLNETSGLPPDVGTGIRCWSSLVSISTDDLMPAGTALTDVPLRVETSVFGQHLDTESLHFYQAGTLLAHELEGAGRFAWVRIPALLAESNDPIEARTGAECPPVMDRLSIAEVWSAGYVAVFHFDDAQGDAREFADSVNGIVLTPDLETELSRSNGFLGPYVQKFGDAALQATDSQLNFSGSAPLSMLGWVRLAADATDVLPWTGNNARHRELVSKLPGYRLGAVLGQTSMMSDVQSHPFVNVSASSSPQDNDVASGDDPVDGGTWTMLAGTYTGSSLELFVDDERVAAERTNNTPGANDDGTIRIGRWLQGDVDEVRISSEPRSLEWIRIQHASMTGAEGLLTYGGRTQLGL